MTHSTAAARPEPRAPVSSEADAEAYVAMVCFKHGPPSRIGVELEWTVHHRDHPDRPIDAAHLVAALGRHTPVTLAPHTAPAALPHGSLVTVEPGGQVELSSLPHRRRADLLDAVAGDLHHLDVLLDRAGLVRGCTGIDPHRPPRRLLEVPRYAAMQQFFDDLGPHGSSMMCSTASMQVCLDAGEPVGLALRWRTLHQVGPALVALFANSPVAQGVRTGWASNRLRATLGTCPPVTQPCAGDRDPVDAWVDVAMSAPVMCVRREAGSWAPARPMTFAEWVAGAVEEPPTYDDLDYHLSTLFPPVRPRGYIEVRYLDIQPDDRWHLPVVLLDALLSAPEVAERACELTEPCADLWLTAARQGLDHAGLRTAARRLVRLAVEHVDGSLDRETLAEELDDLVRRTEPDTARRQPA